MKKHNKILLVLMILIIGLTCFSGCRFFITSEISSISFENSEMEVSIGEKKALPIVISPKNFTEGYYYISSDEDIAKVSGDNVEGVNAGEAVVTVITKINKLKATILIKVDYAEVDTVNINYTGVLNQEHNGSDDFAPEEIVFSASTNAHTDPLVEFGWQITEKDTETILKTSTEKSIAFTMPNIIGKTYEVKVICEGVESVLEFGLYDPMHDVVLNLNSLAVLGEISELELSWPEDCSANPEIQWYIKVESGYMLLSEYNDKKTIEYIPKTHISHKFYAIVDGIESNEITFLPEYNEVKEVFISVKSPIIKENTNLSCTLQYGSKYLDPSSTVVLEIFANGDNNDAEVIEEKASDFSIENFEIPYQEAGTYTLFVKLNGIKSNEITIEVYEYFPTLDKIELEVTDLNTLTQKGESFSDVTITAVANPFNSKIENIEWYVNDIKADTNDNVFTLSPTAVGEYHIQVKSGNIESKYLTVVCTKSSSIVNNYLNNYHYYGGYEQNFYITNQREMDNVIQYAIANRLYGSDSDKLKIYVDYDESKTIGSKIDLARSRYPEAGYLPGFIHPNANKGAVEIRFKYEGIADGGASDATPLSPTQHTSGNGAFNQNAKAKPHYANNVNSTRTLYIDTVNETMDVISTNMLYKAVQWGYKPNIKGYNSTNINTVYDNTKTILRKIINEDMSEFEKVHAIYDWLCYDVAYDYDLLNVGDNPNIQLSYYGYYLEGVLLDLNDKRAVCDGKAKAFVLMCGMEGIKAVRIAGEASGGGHAWNKVLIDADQDGYKEWYVVDSTWDDNKSGNYEYLTHFYFLLNDDEISSTHTERDNPYYPNAENDFSYYKTQTFGIVSYAGDCYIDSQEELENLFKYANQKGWTSVEFYIGYDYSGNLSSLIDTATKTATFNKEGDMLIGNEVDGDKRAVLVLAS